MKTIEDAKNFLRGNYIKGCVCPCCGQFVKLYNRPIHTSMAKDLIRLYHIHNNDDWNKYYHISKIRTRTAGGGDFAKFLYWGLVKELEKDSNDASKRTSGYWKITDKGKQFVENRIKVEKHAIIYNSKLLKFSEDFVNIKDCLKDKFDYNELMNLKI